MTDIFSHLKKTMLKDILCCTKSIKKKKIQTWAINQRLVFGKEPCLKFDCSNKNVVFQYFKSIPLKKNVLLDHGQNRTINKYLARPYFEY